MNALAILLVPLGAAAVLALISDYRLSARINVIACLVSLLAAASLFRWRPASGQYLLIDDMNVVFIVLTNFVAFTTSAFSASYIAH